MEGQKELSHIRFEHKEFTLFLVAIILVQLLFFSILTVFFETPISSFVFGSGAFTGFFILLYHLATREILKTIKLVLLNCYFVILGNSYSYGGIFSPSIWWFAAFVVFVGIFFGTKLNRILVGALFFSVFSIYAAHKLNLFPEPEFVGAGKEELFLISNILLLVLIVFFNKLNAENFAGLLLRTQNSEKQAYISAKMASLGEMAASVAHEVNNPLAIIKGNLQQLQKELNRIDKTNPIIEKKLENISNAIDRAASIVSSLRSVSNSDPKMGLDFSTINEAIGHIKNLMSQQFKNRFIHFEVNISDENLKRKLSLSPVLLSQVFLSLINNSIEFISSLKDKWIKINAEIEADTLMVHVIDSGTGIDPNIQSKMFDPLFSTKEVGKGAGLGLSVSRSMLEKSGAELFYKDLDGHTCFCLNLPVAKT